MFIALTTQAHGVDSKPEMGWPLARGDRWDLVSEGSEDAEKLL
jgi:hypothetical protein